MQNCHATTKLATGGNMYGAWARRKPMYQGIDLSDVNTLTPANVSWDMVKRIRDMTSMKFLLKGIASGEDARLAVEHGVDAIIVSNHGGRAAPEVGRRSKSCPRLSMPSMGRFRCLSIADFAEGKMYSRRSRLVRERWVSAGAISGIGVIRTAGRRSLCSQC